MTPSSQQSFILSYRESSICLFTNTENYNIKKYWTSFQNSSFKQSWFILHQVSATLFYGHQRAMQTGSWTAFSLKTAFSFDAHKICLSFGGLSSHCMDTGERTPWKQSSPGCFMSGPGSQHHCPAFFPLVTDCAFHMEFCSSFARGLGEIPSKLMTKNRPES